MAQCFWYNQKFCKTCSQQGTNTRAFNQSEFKQNRLVFATGGSGGGPGEGSGGGLKPDEMTVETLADDLESLRGTSLTPELVDKAKGILATADAAIKAQLLLITKKIVEGHYTPEGFKVELERVAASAAEGGAPSPEAPETPVGGGPAGVTTGATPVDKIRSSISEELAATSANVDKMIESAKRKKETPEELTSTLKEIKKSIKQFIDIETQTRKEEVEALEQLVKLGMITSEDANDVVDLSIEDPDFDSKWHNIMEDVIQDARHRNTAEKIKNLKRSNNERYKQIEEDVGKKMNELREVLGKAGADIIEKGDKERNLREYGKSIGFNLEEGKTLRFKDMRIIRDKDGKILQDENGQIAGYEPVFRKATIKRVFYDEKGPTLIPSVELEIEDEWEDKNGNKNEKETVVIDAVALKKYADRKEMVEYIDDRQDTNDTDKEVEQLSSKEILGTTIAVGDSFEYRQSSVGSDGNPTGADKKVTIQEIKKITSADDPRDFFGRAESQKKDMKQTVIKLDKKVVVATDGGRMVEKDTLTLGEFAKWYRRMDATKPLTLEELKSRLDSHANELNDTYNRTKEQYPPIQVVPGEMLYYDTEPQKNFKIQDVSDDKITLDNGAIFTPAAFLSWVKNNNVEKKDAAAEAHKLTDRIEDEKEREEKFEAEKNNQEDKIQTESEQRDKGVDKDGNKLVKDNSEVPAAPSKSYIRHLWNNTYFMSLGDMYAMGTEIGEFIKRTLERRQKGRVGAVGNAALSPIYSQLGAEFKTMEQTSENERVNFFTEAYKQLGPGELFERMKVTSNRDELKALFQTLAEKGAIRWDDSRVHDAINRVARWYDAPCFVKGYDTDAMQKVLDSWWGEQTFNELRSKNNSAYGQTKSSYLDEAKRLENDPEKKGGMTGQLQTMLYKHIHGTGYVDPAVYEAYLHYAVMAGKLSFADKMYFIFMALGSVGHPNSAYPGQSLLNFGRISDMEGELLNNFPILDYFTTSRLPMVDENGNPLMDPATGMQKIDQMDVNYVRNVVRKYIGSEGELKSKSAGELGATDALMKFIEREIILDKIVLSRLEKAAGDSKRWDHDDMHMFVPHLPSDVVDSLTLGVGPGAQSTPEGKRNALVGFNNYVKIFVEEIEENVVSNPRKAEASLGRMMKSMSAFVKFNGILEDRYYHGTHDRARLSREALRSLAVTDGSRIVKEHVDELNEFIGTFADNMKKELDAQGVSPNPFDELSNNWHNVIRQFYKAGDKTNQDTQTEAIKNFYTHMDEAVKVARQTIKIEGIARVLAKTQRSGPGGRNLCQGILDAPKTKEEMEKREAQNEAAQYGIVE